MVQVITSASNPLVKLLKSLHAKKGRAETGLFLAEGARLAIEAGELGVWPSILAYSPSALGRPQVRALLAQGEEAGARLVETSERVLAQISKRDNPQTVLGAYPKRLTELDCISGGVVVALEGVRDPGNLGTIVRTADGVGAAGVVLIGEACDPFSVEAVRASMGSLFAIKLARASFERLLAFKRARRMPMIGASLNGTQLGETWSPPSELILLMGNEQSGLNKEMEAACDVLARLPMRGRADSLNLAIATGALLYDIWRRLGYDGARD